MGLVQKYYTLINIGTTEKRLTVIPHDKNGILLAVDVVWWPFTRTLGANDPDFGISQEGTILFHFEDGTLASSGQEILGTSKDDGHRIQVSKKDQNFAWVHPQQTPLLWVADWVSKFQTQLSDNYVGQFVNGVKILAVKGTGAEHHLAIGLQWIEFD